MTRTSRSRPISLPLSFVKSNLLDSLLHTLIGPRSVERQIDLEEGRQAREALHLLAVAPFTLLRAEYWLGGLESLNRPRFFASATV